MTRRSGMTLVEVLVAIFIMAIGLLALLTLFPLGALTMAQAIKDQRAAEAGRNAAAAADTTFEDPNTGNKWTLRTDPVVQTTMVTPPGLPPLTANVTARSYPVLVDPIGQQAGMGSVAVGPGYPGLPRTSMTALSGASNALIYRWTTLLDDITFDENAVPDLGNPPSSVQREGRYSWAWLVQADRASSASQGIVNVNVLVFSGRSLDVSSASGTLALQEENAYVAYFGQDYTQVHTNGYTPRVINIQWTATQQRPNLTGNSWVLDGTLNINSANQTAAPDHATFYRVLNVTDTGIDSTTGNNQMDVEVQEDLQSPSGNAQPWQGNVIVFDKLVEVIRRQLQ